MCPIRRGNRRSRWPCPNSFGFGGHNVSLCVKTVRRLGSDPGHDANTRLDQPVSAIRFFTPRLYSEGIPEPGFPLSSIGLHFSGSGAVGLGSDPPVGPGRETLEHYHSNERLEFLGDSVLGMVVTEALYRRYPHRSEGRLTRAKSVLVSREALARQAQKLDLGPYLFLGPGEERSGGRSRHSILSNAVEAVLGAIYLDGGLARRQPVGVPASLRRDGKGGRGPVPPGTTRVGSWSTPRPVGSGDPSIGSSKSAVPITRNSSAWRCVWKASPWASVRAGPRSWPNRRRPPRRWEALGLNTSD